MLADGENYRRHILECLAECELKNDYRHIDFTRCREGLFSRDFTRWHYVSLNEAGKLEGYVGMFIDVEKYLVEDVSVVNFTRDISLFLKDLVRLYERLFERYHFNKVRFQVARGSEAEPVYDRFVRVYGGRVVGVAKNELKLGEFSFDMKLYEVTHEDYYRSLWRIKSRVCNE